MNTVSISGRFVGNGFPCFIIAEAGVNHNGSLDMAYLLVDEAIKAGADAVKFQTFRAEKVVSPYAAKASYQIETTGNTESQLEMVRKLELSYEDFRLLHSYCQKKGILFLSTPFDEESADFLVELGMPAIKVSSGEITNLPFLAHLARLGKPLIISTGMSTLGEVESAILTVREAGDPPMILLHCVCNYPADPAEVNLRAMLTMEQAFGLPVGFSDHTLGIAVPLAAAALGACVVEKHFTLDRSLPGPDQRASLEPTEFREMINGIRTVESALGDGHKRPTPGEANTAEVARRSLVAATDIASGTKLTVEMIAIRRPGTGLPPVLLKWLIGRRVKVQIQAGQLFQMDLLE